MAVEDRVQDMHEYNNKDIDPDAVTVPQKVVLTDGLTCYRVNTCG